MHDELYYIIKCSWRLKIQQQQQKQQQQLLLLQQQLLLQKLLLQQQQQQPLLLLLLLLLLLPNYYYQTTTAAATTTTATTTTTITTTTTTTTSTSTTTTTAKNNYNSYSYNNNSNYYCYYYCYYYYYYHYYYHYYYYYHHHYYYVRAGPPNPGVEHRERHQERVQHKPAAVLLDAILIMFLGISAVFYIGFSEVLENVNGFYQIFWICLICMGCLVISMRNKIFIGAEVLTKPDQDSMPLMGTRHFSSAGTSTPHLQEDGDWAAQKRSMAMKWLIWGPTHYLPSGKHTKSYWKWP